MANDYNLGRAVGEVVITADTDGATRAMGDYERATEGATEAAQQQSRVERELTDRRRVATEAANRRKDAEAEYKRVMADSTATVEDQVRAEEERNRARGEHLQAARRAADAERAYRAEIIGNVEAVNRFTRSLDQAAGGLDSNTNRMREMRREADQLSRSLNVVSSTMSSALGSVAKGTALTGGGLAAGGLLGLLGAGGAQGLISGIGGITAAIIQYSGALGLLPAVAGGAATVIGTLAIATQGFGEAMKSWDDPEKFVEQINKLGPATRQAALEVYQYRDAIKGAQNVIADGLFEPMIREIEPLIQTLLPVMMNLLRNVAQVIGETGAEFMQWLRSSETVAAITEFINNLVDALRIAQQAMAPFLDAFRTLGVVGSQFLPQLAQILVNIANSFNQMVQGAASDGRLQAWIQSAITAFQLTLDIIQNVGSAISNIFSLSGSDSGNFLRNLEEITRQWKTWTESMEGQSSILEFFAVLREATSNLMPILGEIGTSIGIIIRTLVGLGNSSASGLLSFFTSISEALRTLEPSLVAAGPAIGEAFAAIGEAIVQIVQGVGPELPNIFQTFTDVLKDLLPIIVTVVNSLASLLGSLTPGQIELILGLALAFRGLGGALSVAMTLLPALSGAAAALGIGLGPLIGIVAAVVAVFATFFTVGFMVVKHWDDIKAAAGELWERLKEFGSWLGEFFGNIATQAFEWGKSLINGLIDGIWSMLGPVREAVNTVAEIIDDFLHPGSPTKRGPLSDISTETMGERLAGGLAEGIGNSEGAVTTASGRVAGGVASSFTSAGVAGQSGSTPKSGFEQWVEGITGELSMWSRFFQNAMGIAKSVADMFVQGTKIVASLWNQGDNPLTRPGGIAGPPVQEGNLPGQKGLFGVPSQDPGQKGEAPIAELTPQHYMDKDDPTQGGKLPGQKDVTGVPSANPPAKTQGSAPPKVQGSEPPKTQGTPGGPVTGAPGSREWLQSSLLAQGIHPDQVRGLLAMNQVEGGEGDPRSILGFTDAQAREMGGGATPEGHLKAFLDYQWTSDRTKGLYQDGRPPGTAPDGSVVNEDAYLTFLRQMVGQEGVQSDWEGNQQPAASDYQNRLKDAWGNIDPPKVQGSAPANSNGGGDPLTEAGLYPPITGPGGRRTLNASDFGGIDLQETVTGVPLPGGPVVTGTGGRGVAGPQVAPIPRGGVPQGIRAQLGAPGSYGIANPGSRTEDLPQWVQDLGAAFGLGGSTYHNHQVNGAGGQIPSGPVEPNPEGLNRGIDWWPLRDGKQYTDMSGQSYTPEELSRLDAFAKFLADNGLSEQVIWRNPDTKEAVGFPFNTDYSGAYGGHEGHVHTRHSAPINLGPEGIPLPAGFGGNVQGTQGPSTQGQDRPRVQGIPLPGGPVVGPSGGARPEILPQAPRIAEGYTAEDMRRYNEGAATPPSMVGQIGATAGQTGRAFNSPQGFQGATGQNNAASTQAPLDQFGSAVAAAGNIAGDAFRVFDDVIKNIDATAKIAVTLNRGFENTEDVNKTVDQVQTFITTAADIAKLVASGTGMAAGMVGAGAGSDPSGGAAGAAAALGAVSSIASLVSAGLTAVNAGIDLGQEAYRIVSKYGAMFAGIMLGGPDTGALGGNVRMMLNTRTGELISYSADNPDNKEAKNLPNWISRAYGGTREQPVYQQTQLNVYTGPGSNPQNLISDTMWLVNSGAPQAASVSGYD